MRDADYFRRRIESLEAGLKYADHGAYGQDKERIAELKRELSQLEETKGNRL